MADLYFRNIKYVLLHCNVVRLVQSKLRKAMIASSSCITKDNLIPMDTEWTDGHPYVCMYMISASTMHKKRSA